MGERNVNFGLGLIRAPPAGHEDLCCFEESLPKQLAVVRGYHNLPAGGGVEHYKTPQGNVFEKMVESIMSKTVK